MAEALRVNAEQMQQFVAHLFPYADEDSFVSLRAFDQQDRGRPPVEIKAIRLGDTRKLLVEAGRVAEIAANSMHPAVFAPPVATFTNASQARHIDLANGVALSVELDAGDTQAARRKLEHILGPVTICMASGSEWTDDATGECHPKLHLHWRLSEPTRTAPEHDKLRDARWYAAVLVGADRSAAPPCHPLRWPGSWNTKREPKMARILIGNQAAEIHLSDALDRLQVAVEAAGLDAQPEVDKVTGAPQAPLSRISSALAAVPNDDAEWSDWNRIGMAMWRATGGSADGLKEWADWSNKSRKHEEQACADRWVHYPSSPPTRIGAGTIIHLAKANGWTEQGEPPAYSEEAWQSLLEEHADHTGEQPSSEKQEAKPEDGRLFSVLWFNEISPVLNVLDFVQGVLIEGSSAVVYGESNAGKTFWVTDLALHIAAGRTWNGRRIEAGGVIYCVLEGGVGFKNRVFAWKKTHGYEGVKLPFGAIQSGINLLDPTADTPKLISTIKAASIEVQRPVKLVIIDTLARAMAGGNENASEDMGALVRNMDEIRTQTGACVLFIHHSGKDQSKGSRGHSSLKAAIDTEIEVVADETLDSKSATVLKQREMKKGDVFSFSLKIIALGPNRHKEDVTTCVVVHADADAPPKPAMRSKLKGHNQRAFEVLTNLIAQSGNIGYAEIPPGCPSVPEKWWRERFYSDAVPGDTPEAKKKAFSRASGALIEFHYVGMSNSRVWIIPYQTGHNGGQNAGHV